MSTDHERVQSTLRNTEVHDRWVRGFRTGENDPFYSLAFERVAALLGAPDGCVLDAGCGSGTKAMHLARRGYRVIGVDFSEQMLERARQNLDASGLADRAGIVRGDLLSLPFADGSIHGVVSWGVLMHVPRVEEAIGELVRVTRPGGTIVISESNRRSLQAVGLRALKRVLGRERAEVRVRPSGLEFWEETSAGRLVTRQADARYLIREFGRRGAMLVERRSGQLTEIYTLVPWKPVRSLIHAANNAWFRWAGWPGPAFGNLFAFRKAG